MGILRRLAEKGKSRGNSQHDDRYNDGYYASAREAAIRILKAAGAPSPGRGYYNFKKWTVRGKRADTGRMNTVSVFAADAGAAREEGRRLRNMAGPIEVTPEEPKPAPMIEELGIRLPADAIYEDWFELENSAFSFDAPMSPVFYNYLTDCKIPVSRVAGRTTGAHRLLSACDDRGKAMFYAYAVDCCIHGTEPGDIRLSPRAYLYENFADDALKDKKLLTSIVKRAAEDFWKPNKKTNAWTYTFEWLGVH